MSQINPFVASILSTPAGERAQALAKQEQIERKQRAARASMTPEDSAHFVESTDEPQEHRDEHARGKHEATHPKGHGKPGEPPRPAIDLRA